MSTAIIEIYLFLNIISCAINDTKIISAPHMDDFFANDQDTQFSTWIADALQYTIVDNIDNSYLPKTNSDYKASDHDKYEYEQIELQKEIFSLSDNMSVIDMEFEPFENSIQPQIEMESSYTHKQENLGMPVNIIYKTKTLIGEASTPDSQTYENSIDILTTKNNACLDEKTFYVHSIDITNQSGLPYTNNIKQETNNTINVDEYKDISQELDLMVAELEKNSKESEALFPDAQDNIYMADFSPFDNNNTNMIETKRQCENDKQKISLPFNNKVSTPKSLECDLKNFDLKIIEDGLTLGYGKLTANNIAESLDPSNDMIIDIKSSENQLHINTIDLNQQKNILPCDLSEFLVFQTTCNYSSKRKTRKRDHGKAFIKPKETTSKKQCDNSNVLNNAGLKNKTCSAKKSQSITSNTKITDGFYRINIPIDMNIGTRYDNYNITKERQNERIEQSKAFIMEITTNNLLHTNVIMNKIIQKQLLDSASSCKSFVSDVLNTVIRKPIEPDLKIIFNCDLSHFRDSINLLKYSITETVKNIPKTREIYDSDLKNGKNNSFFVIGPSKNLNMSDIQVNLVINGCRYILFAHLSYRNSASNDASALFRQTINPENIQENMHCYEFFIYNYIKNEYFTTLDEKKKIQYQNYIPLVNASNYKKTTNLIRSCNNESNYSRGAPTFLSLFKNIVFFNLHLNYSINIYYKKTTNLQFIIKYTQLRLYEHLRLNNKGMGIKSATTFSIIKYITFYFGNFSADGSFRLNNEYAILKLLYPEIEYLFEFVYINFNTEVEICEDIKKHIEILLSTTYYMIQRLKETMGYIKENFFIKKIFEYTCLYNCLRRHKRALVNILLQIDPNNLIIIVYSKLINGNNKIYQTLYSIMGDGRYCILWLFKLDEEKLRLYEPLKLLKNVNYNRPSAESFNYHKCLKKYFNHINMDPEFKNSIVGHFTKKLTYFGLSNDQIEYFMGIIVIYDRRESILYTIADVFENTSQISLIEIYFQYLFSKMIIFELYNAFKDCMIYEVLIQ